MIKELLAASAPLNMEIFGLVVFTIVFTIIGFWTFRRSGRKIYSQLAAMPLQEEENQYERRN